jgi:hypothetical protein
MFSTGRSSDSDVQNLDQVALYYFKFFHMAETQEHLPTSDLDKEILMTLSLSSA